MAVHSTKTQLNHDNANGNQKNNDTKIEEGYHNIPNEKKIKE